MITNKEYTDLVAKEKYPSDPTVPLASSFIDERGVIQNLLHCNMNSIAIIETKAGGIRSNHYHKNSDHYIFLISGKIEYFERHINGSNVIKRIYGPKEMFYTGPQKIHKLVALEDTVMLSICTKENDPKSHDDDLVKVEF